MTVEFDTKITMRGTSEELLSMLKVLQQFETEKKQQYLKNDDCGYIEMVTVQGASGGIQIAELSEQKLIDFLSGPRNVLSVEAFGPWGRFYEPGEVGLFEALSEAAPNSFFDGNISGYSSYAEFRHTGK